MGLLAPLFLAGLAGLAIPVVIHLTHRERREPVPFPSLMFVRRVPFRAERRRRIRDPLLFALRAAAIVLASVAFARPLFRGAGMAAVGVRPARDVVLLVDRSYSMEYGDRWSRALGAAREVVDGLGADDRLALVFFSDRVEAASRLTGDRVALRGILDTVRTEGAVTRYAPAFRLVRDLLIETERPRRQLVLVTDLQRVGWEPRDAVRLPPGVDVRVVDVSDPAPANHAVAEARIQRMRDGGTGRATVSARVVNLGDRAVRGLRLALEVDGTELRTATADIAGRGAARVTFAPVPLPDRPARARILADRDALPRDDVFHFVLAPGGEIPVLLVEAASAAPAEALYLRRALGLGDDPRFRVATASSAPAAGELAERPVVILNDVPFPAGAGAARLRRFVEEGGGVLAVLGPRAGAATLASVLPELVAEGTPEPVDRLEDAGAGLAILGYDHPALARFRTPGTGDFSAARFFRYRRVRAGTEATVLARFDDGAPALVEARIGGGRALVIASDLGNAWNDLPLQPVFLPLLHRLLRHLADYREAPAAHTVGQALEVAEHPAAGAWARAGEDTELVVESPGGSRTVTAPGAARLELRETGFYTVRPLDAARGEPLVLAVNPDPRESDLTAMAAEELVTALTAPSDEGAAGPPSPQPGAPLTAEELERRQGLWWYLLVAALLVLAGESALGARASQPAR